MRLNSPRLRSESGIATLAVITMSVVLTIIGMFILDIGRGTSQGVVEANHYFSTAEIIKANIYTLTANPVAWGHTVDRNGAFDCIRNKVTCATAGNHIAIYFPNNTLYYSHTAGYGFRLDGEVCTTYDPDDKKDGGRCIIRPTVRWKPYCSIPCLVPPSKGFVYVTFETPTIEGYNFNEMNIFGLSKP